jgi:hypothetical protein
LRDKIIKTLPIGCSVDKKGHLTKLTIKDIKDRYFSQNPKKFPCYLGIHKADHSKGTNFLSGKTPTAGMYPEYANVVGPFKELTGVMKYAKMHNIKVGMKENPVKGSDSFQRYEQARPVMVAALNKLSANLKDYSIIAIQNYLADILLTKRYTRNKHDAKEMARWYLRENIHQFKDIDGVLNVGFKKNPLKKPTKIYANVLAIEAVKHKDSLWPEEKFRHDFQSKSGKASIYGMPDGSLMIKGKKRLWKNFNYSKNDISERR